MPQLPLGTYDPTKVNISFGGVTVDGFAEGTFIKATRNNDAWAWKGSNSGGGGRSRNPDKSGRLEFTLHAQSPSNGYLTQIARLDELTGTGVRSCAVKDRTSFTSNCFAGKAWIEKIPDFERGREIGEVTWILECDELDIYHDGSIPTLAT